MLNENWNQNRDTFFTFQVTDVIYMADLWKIKPGNSSKKSVGRKSNFEYDFNIQELVIY